MSKVSDDFVRFLKINFPDDYRKVTVDDVKDDVVNSILLKYEKKYRIWLSIPEWIKNEYRDDLPDDVLNGNTTVREFINEEEEKKLDREQENEKLGSFGLSLVAAGYTVECAKTLAENREKRRALMCKGCALTDDEKEIIRQTREVDKETILRDWKDNQNEKYFMHLLRDWSCCVRKSENTQDVKAQAGFDMKEASVKREFNILVNMLNDENFKRKLERHLKTEAAVARLNVMHPKVLEEVSVALDKYGIDVKSIAESKKKKTKSIDKSSMIMDLKKQYEDRIKNNVVDDEFMIDGDLLAVKDKISPKVDDRVLRAYQINRGR
ncbi:MAG: hypothetical protein IKW39_02455 [Alphaproteobacteria bacterium]|nr:hypothetical protein [Alphaproteobacteria bacterium]